MYPTEDRGTHLKINLYQKGNPHEVLIDYDTYERMLKYGVKISLSKNNHSKLLFVYIFSINGTSANRSFAKWILGATEKYLITFKNLNTLDFQRKNLVSTDRSGVCQNRSGAQVNSKSNVRGVSYDPERNKWRACVYVHRKRVFSDRFENVEDAEKAVIEARNELMEHSFKDK